MFDVWYVCSVAEYARRLVERESFGRRGVADGTPEQQVAGLLGQTIVHDLFGLPWPQAQGRADGGVDLMFQGLTLDVKTMGRKVPPRPQYANNYMRLQAHFSTDVLLFCSLNTLTETLTVCGWITKAELLQKATLHPAGTQRRRADGTTLVLRSDVYEIRNRDLHSPDCFDDLVRELRVLADHGRAEVFTV